MIAVKTEKKLRYYVKCDIVKSKVYQTSESAN